MAIRHFPLSRIFLWVGSLGSIFVLSLSACTVSPAGGIAASPSPAAVIDTPAPSQRPAFTATTTQTATVTPSLTPSPIPSATATPAPIPLFQAKLPAGVTPESYIQDACKVIELRWSPQNSAPGTIVVPVMIHSIAKPGRPISDDTTISEEYYLRFIEYAHQNGFETITTAQLVDFLQNNAKIPARSMMLIVDDRKRAEFYDTYFIPYIKKYHYTVTNAWIAHPDTPDYLWKENEQFAPGGEVDFQAHGVIHNTPIDSSVTEAYARSEIFGPIQPMETHFGKRPIAFIWPRGLFTPQAVQIAREAKYQVGFTATPRGPLLFDWIPQGPEERAASDPLMVLPRYWDTTAIAALTEAMQVSQAAQAFYADQRPTDLAYYAQYCQSYPPLQ